MVTNGLTVGHFCCSALDVQLQMLAQRDGEPFDGPCTRDLPKNRDQFCSHHFGCLNPLCYAQPCLYQSVNNINSCSLEPHIIATKKFLQNGKQNFKITSILNHPDSCLRLDPTVHQDCSNGNFHDFESIKQADEADRYAEKARDGGVSASPQAPRLSQRRTHNNQLIVGTCGVILVCQTMFRAESQAQLRYVFFIDCAPATIANNPSFKLFLMDTFPKDMPEVIFYDNACKLLAHIFQSPED